MTTTNTETEENTMENWRVLWWKNSNSLIGNLAQTKMFGSEQFARIFVCKKHNWSLYKRDGNRWLLVEEN